MSMPQSTPLRPAKTLLAASLTLGTGFISGCVTTWLADNSVQNDAIRPDDFIGDPAELEDQTTQIVSEAVAENATGDNTDQDPANPVRPANKQALSVNAMVGHINGEALFADQVFDVNLAAQLQSFGERYDVDQFNQQAAAAIQERLRGVIINKLILGEAERNLNDKQRAGIEARVQAEREELIRFYGQGSVSKAKAQFLDAQGKDLDEHLIAFREEMSIGFYIQSRVLPKIVVNQADIRRWFEDNKELYNKPDTRVIRLIRTDNPASTQRVQARLDRGESFQKIATDATLNTYDPEGGGALNGGEPVQGKVAISIGPVNDALLLLEAGQHAGPITAGKNEYFVQVVQFTPGVEVPLSDVQLEIETRLRAEQFERHALRFRLDLLKRGNFSDIDQMSSKLLEIARARYDR